MGQIPPFFQGITEFIFIEDEPEKADIIFVPGGNFTGHVLTAAGLYHDGFAPFILPSGRFALLAGRYAGPEEVSFETEWEYMRYVLMGEGVPEEAILKEDEATFTWENAILSRKFLEERGMMPERALLCCQAYHSRRAYMYYQQQFPDTEILVIPTVTDGISADDWFLDRKKTEKVLGEVERIGKQFSCALPLADPIGYRG